MPSSTCPSSLLPGGTLALGGSWDWGGGVPGHIPREGLFPHSLFQGGQASAPPGQGEGVAPGVNLAGHPIWIWGQ